LREWRVARILEFEAAKAWRSCQVPSVEQSSTTMTSATLGWANTFSSTDAIVLASLKVGTITESKRVIKLN